MKEVDVAWPGVASVGAADETVGSSSSAGDAAWTAAPGHGHKAATKVNISAERFITHPCPEQRFLPRESDDLASPPVRRRTAP